MASNPTVKEIVKKLLEHRGYEGLFNPLADCACALGELMPCDEPRPGCTAGYRAPDVTGEHDFRIVPVKPGPEEVVSGDKTVPRGE